MGVTTIVVRRPFPSDCGPVLPSLFVFGVARFGPLHQGPGVGSDGKSELSRLPHRTTDLNTDALADQSVVDRHSGSSSSTSS